MTALDDWEMQYALAVMPYTGPKKHHLPAVGGSAHVQQGTGSVSVTYPAEIPTRDWTGEMETLAAVV